MYSVYLGSFASFLPLKGQVYFIAKQTESTEAAAHEMRASYLHSLLGARA